MPFVVTFDFITGLVLGLEYFNEDEETPFTIAIDLFFIRIIIMFNAVINDDDDHNDLGDMHP